MLKIDTLNYPQSNNAIPQGRIEEELHGFSEIKDYFQNEYSYECQRKINYLFTDYSDYGRNIQDELEKRIGVKIDQLDGGKNLRKCGKVYFLMIKHGTWESLRYWAVEVDAETGKLIKWNEVTKGEKDIDDSKIWWKN